MAWLSAPSTAATLCRWFTTQMVVKITVSTMATVAMFSAMNLMRSFFSIGRPP